MRLTDSDAGGEQFWGKASRDPVEKQFLQGPRSRFAELLRAVRIFGEFIKGFRALHFVPPCVTVFGSARFREDNPWYALARQVARVRTTGCTHSRGRSRPDCRGTASRS